MTINLHFINVNNFIQQPIQCNIKDNYHYKNTLTLEPLMRKFIVRLITSSILLFCALQTTHAAEKKAWVYVVSNGDSLWNITAKFLKDINYYTELQKINNIKYPKKIKPGNVIRIPMKWIKHSPASARISFIQGESQFLRNNKFHTLTPETTLVLGDEIRTGENGSTTVVFADGSEMVLFKNTIVAFDHLSSYGKTGMVDTRIRVIQGKVETNAKKNKGPGSRLDILTPSAISSVRGTVYRVSNTKSNISTVEVIEGDVSVAGKKSNKSISVKTGQGTRIEKGIEPTKPVPLLSPPKVITTQTYFEQIPTITWNKIKKAERYNIQLSSQKNFKEIVWGKITTDTSIALPKLSDAVYYYRITAIDLLGIEGLPVYKSYTLNLSPIAPKLIHTPELILGNKKLSTLTWVNNLNSTENNVERYKIEIAKDKSFTQPVLEKTITEKAFALPENLGLGEYFWRVSSINGSDKGPASTPLAFNWKTAVEQPYCSAQLSSETSSEGIDISWPIIKNNQTMFIEISTDNQFQTLIKSYKVNSEKNTVQYTTDEEVFIRCKIILNDTTIESKWSEVQHISQLDKGIMSLFGFLMLIILI